MDDDLIQLRRRAQTDPTDARAAAQLDRALLRAGQTQEAGRRYRFAFRCPLRFDDLTPRADPRERHCERCQRTVQLVRTPEELAARVAEGGCAAIPRGSLAAACVDLARDPRLGSAVRSGAPCVQPTDLPFVDLDTWEVPELAIQALPGVFARTYRALAVALSEDGKRLQVACADMSRAALVQEDLAFMLGIEVELVLADPDAVDRALERVYPDDDEDPPQMAMMGALCCQPDDAP